MTAGEIASPLSWSTDPIRIASLTAGETAVELANVDLMEDPRLFPLSKVPPQAASNVMVPELGPAHQYAGMLLHRSDLSLV
jgi:hypothetical protein